MESRKGGEEREEERRGEEIEEKRREGTNDENESTMIKSLGGGREGREGRKRVGGGGEERDGYINTAVCSLALSPDAPSPLHTLSPL